jgi:hypothetical protein
LPFYFLLFTSLSCGDAGKKPESAAPAPPPAAAGYEATDLTNGGGIVGIVKLAGAIPKLPPRPVTKSQEFCGHGTKPSEEVVAGTGGVLSNVVVAIEGIKKGKKILPSNPVLDQVKCDYVPHVQSITAGSTLEIRNSDDLLHNVHGKLDGRATIFNLAMPLKGQRIPKQLTKPGLVILQCDAGHTWMKGYLVIVDHPYHATTDSRGSFSLSNVPPGTYKVKAWHERLGTLEQEVAVSPGTETRISFEFKSP